MSTKNKEYPSQEYLNSIFEYNETTGDLIWKPRTLDTIKSKGAMTKFNTEFAGKKLNYIGLHGYYCTKLNKHHYLVHRIIWKMIHGVDAEGVIDHINRDKLDNRLKNLRDVSQKENLANKGIQKNNKTGTIGIKYDEKAKKYSGHFAIRGNHISTKRYSTLHEAEIELDYLKGKNYDHLLTIPKKSGELTFDYLQGNYRYENGTLVRLIDGKRVGSMANYETVNILGKTYQVHRIIYWLCTGIMPTKSDIIDHIDGNPLNNLISNLRLVNHKQNSINAKVASNSKSGVTGVYFFKRDSNWKATIYVDKKQIHLGTFATKEEAILARKQAEELYHGEFARNT